MNVMYFLLIFVVVAVVIIDIYLKKKNKLSNSLDIKKSENLKPSNNNRTILLIVSSIIILLISFVVIVNKTHCNGNLFEDDGLSYLDKITADYYDFNLVDLVGDSIYQQKGSNSYVNGILFCSYGNIGKVFNGKPDGLFTLYHSNGQKKMQVKLINGKQEGFRKDWFSDGQKGFEGYYVNDKQTGLSKFWFQNGQLELEGEFDQGRFSGSYKRYYKDGQLRYEFDNNEKTYREYWDNGSLYCISKNTNPHKPIPHLVNGKRLTKNIEFFDKEKNLINSSNTRYYGKKLQKAISKSTGKYCSLKRNSYGELLYDKENCDLFFYYLNGNVMAKWEKNQLINCETKYYENGEIQQILMYYPDNEETYYFRNGLIKRKVERSPSYSNISYYEDGIENENRLFVKNKELYF